MNPFKNLLIALLGGNLVAIATIFADCDAKESSIFFGVTTVIFFFGLHGLAAKKNVAAKIEPTLVELLATADEDMQTAHWDGAIGGYLEALEVARTQFGRDSMELVPILVKLSDAYTARDQAEWYDDINPNELLRALAISEQHHGVLSRANEPLLVALTSFYDLIGAENKAVAMVRRLEQLDGRALVLPIESGNEEPEAKVDGKSWEAKASQARQLLIDCNYKEGIQMFEAAIELAHTAVGPYGIALAPMLNELGLAYQARDDDKNDTTTIPVDYLRSLAVCERAYGVFAAELIPVLSNLCSFYDQIGEHHRAQSYIVRLQFLERK